jgi:hypothetical protein
VATDGGSSSGTDVGPARGFSVRSQWLPGSCAARALPEAVMILAMVPVWPFAIFALIGFVVWLLFIAVSCIPIAIGTITDGQKYKATAPQWTWFITVPWALGVLGLFAWSFLR